ncbi:hypothetical protein ACOSP7_028487 [Xanthoceras sorbifolium]
MLLLFHDHYSPIELETLCAIWWLVWFIRNVHFHLDGGPVLAAIVAWSSLFLLAFHVANTKVDSDSTSSAPRMHRVKDVKWKPPNSGVYKINSDACVDVDNLRTGIRPLTICLFEDSKSDKSPTTTTHMLTSLR